MSNTTTTTMSNYASNGTGSADHNQQLKDRFRLWAISFAQLDPRQRIHRFFQGVAQKGEWKLREETVKRQSVLLHEMLHSSDSTTEEEGDQRARLLKEVISCFDFASVFTVWRPTSHDAIRKMMETKGVGKGLDIKGKSAKFGRLSGYVPFLQVHNDNDKNKILALPASGRVRVFYASEKTRKKALHIFEIVCDEMVEAVEQSQEELTEFFRLRDSVSGMSVSDGNHDRFQDDAQQVVDNDEDFLAQAEAAKRMSAQTDPGPTTKRDSTQSDDPGPYGDGTDYDDGFNPRGSAGSNRRPTFRFGSLAASSTGALRRTSTTGVGSASTRLGISIASRRIQEWEMDDPTIRLINEYSREHNIFGLDVPERLLWEAFVVRQEVHCCHWRNHFISENRRRSLEDFSYNGYVIKEEKEEAGDGNPTSCPKENGDGDTTHSPQEKFPQKLMRRMMEVEKQGSGEKVVKWVHDAANDSWSFVIIDPDKFVQDVLLPIQGDGTNGLNSNNNPSNVPAATSTMLSRKKKYSSFVGALRGMGFAEQTTGKGHARFCHQYFQKGHIEACALIGSEHDVGRNSMASSQDANFKSLRKIPKYAGEPRVVLWAHDEGTRNPLCPHNLLMAYEANGKVVPVVSDFDGFLVGTKRIRFDQELPKAQVELIKSEIKIAQDILAGNAKGDSWAGKWDYAARDYYAKIPPMPRFGFGDSKSYGIMEEAVKCLAKTDGAVRHGAECFNYAFPQEMDQSFLVISDTIEGGVRWKYVDSSQLHYFLQNRVKDGYTFPLNPKWVLCDPGWSKLYDSLIHSDNPNIKASYDVWFPPSSGVREMMEKTKERFPQGLSFTAEATSNNKVAIRERRKLPCITTYAIHRVQHLRRSSQREAADAGPLRPEHCVKLQIDQGSAVEFTPDDPHRAALVCATNESCVPICGGVTQAVVAAGGPQLLEDALALPVLYETSFGPVRCVTGSAKIVSLSSVGDGGEPDDAYGNLGVSHVIWAVGPAFGERFISDNDANIKDDLLRSAYRASLNRAKENNLHTVAFSLLSAGKRGCRWDPDRALRIALQTIVDYEDFGSIEQMHLCAFTSKEVSALQSIAEELELTNN